MQTYNKCCRNVVINKTSGRIEYTTVLAYRF